MKTCKVKGCGGKVHARGYCHKHWQQLYRSGKVLERTRYDKAVIKIDGVAAHIMIHDKRENPYEETIIDVEDVPKVENFKWHIQSKGYVSSKKAGLLHRLIIGAEPAQLVDHINRNKLDNRKANLRIASRSENVRNSKIPITNTTGTKGVCFHRGTRKWEAFINKDGKCIRKLFENIEDAIKFRKELEANS
jgi:hypothetical protein